MLAGMALPRFERTYQRLNQEHHALALVGTLRYAQATAVVERRAYRWEYDPAAATYRLLVSDSDHHETFVHIPGRWGRPHVLPSVLRLDTPRTQITFYPDGRAEAATLTLEGPRGDRFLVTIDGATGHATAQRVRAP